MRLISQLSLFMAGTFTALWVHAGEVKVYAAASLTNAVTEIAKLYQQQHPSTKVVPVYAASSTLAKQIVAGAPSDIFFSADQDWMSYLLQKQEVRPKYIKPLLRNQVVLISPKNLNIKVQTNSHFAFAQAFSGKLCTGQMESVPVGKYAKQSLIKLNWLNSLQGRIVGTDDVRAALTFVERGECDVGIVYKTDALVSHKVKIIGVMPDNSHDAVIYPVALTKVGEQNPEAQQFYRFMSHSVQALAIFKHYGFSINR
ncbi:molybdate ABC transporter, periplasmic molybdate-binding protein [Acinetobacter sp. ANC 3789]|uniref:molybdate ABC transporter substrate-binding protein n=1 Tax=Acinetobacter sp. ANC 3789 TaxID=1217714 RepID=UPI0002D100F4|nr:molybdate ABC transporter, periplasmic molybdate-binding protein [Acinetobacter sp. ANC 3789]